MFLNFQFDNKLNLTSIGANNATINTYLHETEITQMNWYAHYTEVAFVGIITNHSKDLDRYPVKFMFTFLARKIIKMKARYIWKMMITFTKLLLSAIYGVYTFVNTSMFLDGRTGTAFLRRILLEIINKQYTRSY